MADAEIVDFLGRSRAQAAGLSIVATRSSNPDAVGRANVLARELGLPAEAVERNLPDVEQRRQVEQARRIAQRSPLIATWAAEPRHAAVAQNDMPMLSRVGQSALRGLENVGRSLMAGTAGITAGLYGGLQAIAENGPIDLAADALRLPRLGGNREARFFKAQRRRSEAYVSAIRPKTGNWVADSLLSGVESIPTTAAAAAASVAGSPAAGLALFGGATAGSAYGQAREAGIAPGRAAVFAASQGTVEVATERFGFNYLVKGLGKTGLPKFLTGFLGRELAGEEAATVLQDFNDWTVLHPDRPFSEYVAQRPQAAAETALATVAMGGFAGALHVGAGIAGRATKARTGASEQSSIDALMADAAKAKTRTRDPDAFRALLDLHLQDTPAENAYVPGATARELLQSGKLEEGSPEHDWLSSKAGEIEEAAATGGDVVLPLSELVTNLAGGSAWETIRDQVRLSPGGLSPAEAAAYEADHANAMEQLGRDFAEQAAAERATREPRERLTDNARDKLLQAGFTPDAAGNYAALLGARYATRAERRGEVLTGNELDAVDVRRALPEGLAPIVAADQLDVVIDAMRRARGARSDRQRFGQSLLEWIAKKGGIEDRGGDIASMGGDTWHREKPGRRKLIRPASMREQASMLGSSDQQNANTPDELALRAQEAGYFEAGERPTVNDLLDAIDQELRGAPRYAEDRTSATDGVRAAADDLLALLDREDVDPDVATNAQIKAAVQRYQAERSTGRGYEQSVNERFARQLAELKQGTLSRSAMLRLGYPSEALRVAGVPNLEIQMTQSVGRKVFLEKHVREVAGATQLKLPALLGDPVFVVHREDGVFEVIIQNADGAYLLAALKPNRVVASGRANLVLTIHEKLDPSSLVRAIEAGWVTYRSEEKSREWTSWASRQWRGRPIPGGENEADAAAKVKSDRLRKPVLGIKKRLDQAFESGARGRVTFDGERRVIELFQQADLSTFLHESGHIWVEELREDAEAAGATEQVKADWAAVQQWFAEQGHPLVDGAIPTEAHELWARGVERYLMEGATPSIGLQQVFARFRAWLLSIYQVVANLRSPITPEIRGVMSRLLATDEEITDARQAGNVRALFESAKQAGMTAAEFQAYQAATSDARNEAFNALLYRTMETIRRRRKADWRHDEDAVRAEVTRQVDARPEFQVLHALRAQAPRLKLDRAWLVDRYGEDALGLLPRGVPPIYADRETTDADSIAELHGFSDGDEMVRALMGVELRSRQLRDVGEKRSARQSVIDDETAAIMAERHGDPLSDGSIEEEALAAISNEKQGDLIASELRALSRQMQGGPPTPYKLARRWAARKVAAGTVKDVASGAAIQRYSRSAASAARLAQDAMLAGDVDETFRLKQHEMIQRALVAEAREAKERVDQAVARLGKIAKRRTMGSVDQAYLEQAHDLLEQVSLRPESQRQIERRLSFEAWAAEQASQGIDVAVPPSFAASIGTRHWSRLSVEAMIGLDDAVKQIIHLGRLKQSLIDGREQREFEAVVADAVAAVDTLPQKPPSDLMEPSLGDRIRAGVANADAALLKMETVFDWLDLGRGDGVFNRIVFKPIADAQHREATMTADYLGRIRAAMEKVPDIRRWMERVTVPELMNRETGNPFTFTRQQLVAIALNLGNEGNLQRLTDGYNWAEPSIMRALNRELTEHDWQFVQEVWDIIDTLWPEISAMERRVNGVEPDKVLPRPVQTSTIELRGGYYPAIYDTSRSAAAERHAGKASDLLETTYTKATTRAGSTRERSEKVKRPILLQIGVINRHLGEVIHDITHREAVMQADRFLSDSRVSDAIDRTLGREYRQQFRPWLKFVANRWAMERAGNEGLGAFIAKARANTTVVGMGYRITTILTQFAGYSNSFEKVGTSWVTAAIVRTAKSPLETTRFVMERSGEVRSRLDTLDRDIGQNIRQLAGRRDMLSQAKRFAFHGIGYADRVVVVPTWIGAYEKALAGGATEEQAIYEGDRAVRMSQGAGEAKDLAAVQRGTGKWGELLKLTTMFYSYMSAFYQRTRTLGRDAGEAVRDRRLSALPRIMARSWWLLVVPTVLSEVLAGRGPDDDEDWGVWAFKRMVFQLLGPLPIARDLAEPVWNAAAGGKPRDYQVSPLQRAGQSLVVATKDVRRLASGEETKHATKDALEATGYVTGVVPGQVASATQFLVDVGRGEADPQGLADWWKGLSTGKIE